MAALTDDCQFRVFLPQERQAQPCPPPDFSRISFGFMELHQVPIGEWLATNVASRFVKKGERTCSRQT